MPYPKHYAELRHAAHEATDLEALKALVLHVADEIEASERGKVCAFCQLGRAMERLRSGGPCGPCVVLE